MLFVFYGNDILAVRSKARAYIDGLGDVVTLNTIESENYHSGIITNAAQSVSLFNEKQAYLIDIPSQVPELHKEVMEALEALAASAQIFIIIETALLAPERKKYEKYADQIEEYTKVKQEQFSTFSLADALSRKDKKLLWLLLHDAGRAGLTNEEIIGMFWWQLKTLRVAANTSSAVEANMKEFPYNKAKRMLGKFNEGELEALSQKLLTLYHDAREGHADLGLALEQWVLSL